MGVVPLQYLRRRHGRELGAHGHGGLRHRGPAGCSAPKEVTVTATGSDGKKTTFQAIVRIDTPKEQEYFIHGGILQYVLRQLATGKQAA